MMGQTTEKSSVLLLHAGGAAGIPITENNPGGGKGNTLIPRGSRVSCDDCSRGLERRAWEKQNASTAGGCCCCRS